MNKIKLIIYETSFLSDLQRKFYIAMLTERKIRILDFTLNSM